MRPSSSPSEALLRGLSGTPDVDAELGDHALLRALLDAEAALARAARRRAAARRGRRGDRPAVPRRAVRPGSSRCRGRAAGNPVVPLVRELTAAVAEPARPWVHHGATSQDVLDTALSLVAVRARRRRRLGRGWSAWSRPVRRTPGPGGEPVALAHPPSAPARPGRGPRWAARRHRQDRPRRGPAGADRGRRGGRGGRGAGWLLGDAAQAQPGGLGAGHRRGPARPRARRPTGPDREATSGPAATAGPDREAQR